ncbi:EAL domain-containing protein [Thiomicrorhabdus aquaedulcis]|uniref:bifunctional diguanylate cyclase/phosphodiesterase n=1 Tax=Thiomicrorhabdus aquaedulcis TaxID=2211106 RepID=UPI000FDBAFAD|nr:EAL domain-containing protein [Thiomicrorhabdus aquaedulcis]
MSLNKQMIIFIASMLIILLLGTFGLHLSHTKNFLQNQLSSHAQDTATSLGLSLSSISDPSDLSSMETMVNAIFDRGYYAHITLKDMDNAPLYHRENTQEMAQVPNWFINNITLIAPSAEAVIQSGWMPTGTLTVTSHTGYAYAELWKTATNLLLWFFIAAVIAILVVIYALKILLKPLKDIEKQAEAIVKKEYLLQDNLPNTIEFRQVVGAMNAMVHKLKTIFERDANSAERLQKLAYQDSVTQLSNRQHFEMLVDTLLDPNDENVPGMMGVIRVHELKEFNEQFGYLIGDALMKSLARTMQTQWANNNSLFARLNGSELIAVLPGKRSGQIEAAALAMSQEFSQLLKNMSAEGASTSISVAYLDYRPGEQRGSLLGNLDFAINQANQLGKNQSFYYNRNAQIDPQDEHNALHSWESRLTDAFEQKRFLLFQQGAYDQAFGLHYKELFVRLQDFDGTTRSASYFMPAVEQLHKTAHIDKLVVQLALQHLSTHGDSSTLSINLSKALLTDSVLKSWLITTLNQAGSAARMLSFEMPERLVTEDKALAWPFLQELSRLNVPFGLDNFGSHLTNMRYLQDLRPNYVKLDAAFSKVVETDEQTRSYILSLCELADRLEITVIAMAIENAAQQKAFAELGVTYFQGYLYGAPAALV